MRRILATLAAVSVIATIAAAPPVGAKPTKVSESFGGTLLPFPKLAAVGDQIGLARPGCTAGEEGVHWVEAEFTSPGRGNLRFWMEGFTGDHDIYVFGEDPDLPLYRGDQSQVPDMAPPEEQIVIPLTKGQVVTLAACNWFGEPEVLAHYEGTFK